MTTFWASAGMRQGELLQAASPIAQAVAAYPKTDAGRAAIADEIEATVVPLADALTS